MPLTTRSVLVDLDDPSAADPRLAGAKAASLARARQAGLPVLPGCVVPAEEGRAAAGRGAAELAAGRGSGRARLAVMDHPLDPGLHDRVTDAVQRAGGRVVVRSSSTLEHDPVWSGAFSSYDGVGVDEVATAVRGVWASAFTVDALARCEGTGTEPADVCLAVLVQPEVDARFGGTARRLGRRGVVEVVGVAGSPARLLVGGTRGVRVTAHPSGELTGEAVEVLGPEVVRGVADLTRRAADVLGQEAVEWAWVDDSPVLLQARAATHARDAVVTPPVDAGIADAMGQPAALHLASWVTRFPGPLADALVLPWAPGVEVSEVVDRPGGAADVGVTLDEIVRRAETLTAQAWGPAGTGAVRQALVDVREHRSATALRRLGHASPVDPAGARHLVALLRALAAAAAASGLAPDAAQVWRHDQRSLAAALEGAALPARRPDAPDPWEPFLHDFLRCRGTAAGGAPASPGVTTGWARLVDGPDSPVTGRTRGPHRRGVLVAPSPMPALASLLWSASGLVTGPGDSSAHLFEVARALRVPAVVDAEVGRLRGVAPAERLFLAVDGTTGHVWAREV